MDLQQRSEPVSGICCVLGGWKQAGSRRLRLHLHFAIHTGAAAEPGLFGRQSDFFLDCAFNGIGVAAEFRFVHDELGCADEHTHAEQRELAESIDAVAVEQPEFLSPELSLKRSIPDHPGYHFAQAA